jgi:tetratricopeptide (TPR) repeat protein
MKLFAIKLLTFCALLIFLSAASAQQQDSDQIRDIQQRWAKLNYSEDSKKLVVRGLKELAEETEALANSAPENADLQIWSGIVLSTLANKKGGLGALSLVKRAKAKLEEAIKIEPTALGGSAYASLGVLYHKVPGWPMGFGDEDLARESLQKALKINPTGLDVNFFYADFLADTKQKSAAIEYLKIAQAAPTLAGRPVADAGRRKEVQTLLAKLSNG